MVIEGEEERMEKKEYGMEVEEKSGIEIISEEDVMIRRMKGRSKKEESMRKRKESVNQMELEEIKVDKRRYEVRDRGREEHPPRKRQCPDMKTKK